MAPKRRRKPRLFSFSREVELSHFEDAVSRPEDRKALEAVVDAFITICNEQAVSVATLMPIARAARSSSPHVRGVGITRLAVLCHYFEEAQPVMEQVARDPDEDVRLWACSVLANTPERVGGPLIERALDDDSWQVRKAAAQAGSAVVWPTMLPILTRRLGDESDARVRVVLQLAIDFQRSAAREED
jgi:hypothetical protein